MIREIGWKRERERDWFGNPGERSGNLRNFPK